MGRICALFIVLFLGVIKAEKQDEAPIFPVDRELVYSFLGDVSTGVTEPAAALSHFGIKAKLRVQNTEANRAIFKLEEVEHSAYNGAGNMKKLPADEFNFIPVPIEAEAIAKPFAATYRNGKITKFEVENSDSVWSKNFKRALVSLFQMKLDAPRGTAAFISTESGIAGECKVNNLGTYNYKLNEIELRKFLDMSNCSKFEHKIDHTSTICQDKDKKSATGSTERRYTINHEKGAVVINTINSRGGIAFQPFGEFGELLYQVTRQDLKRLSLEAVTSPLVMTEPITTSLTFEIPPPVAEGADYDYTFGRTKRNPDETVNYLLKRVSTYSNKLHSTIEGDGFQNPDDLHSLDFYYVMGMMRQLGRESILQAAEKVLVGTSLIEETGRTIFLNLLSKVGTRASIQASFNLLNEGKVESMQASFLLSSLPFYLRQPSVDMIEDGEILLNFGDKVNDGVKRNAVLTFATLVNRVCKAVFCEPALVDGYVRKFFAKLRESDDYNEQMLYVHALGNIGTETVVDYLEPLIRGQLQYPHQLRYRAIEATKLALKAQPEKVYSIFWPMLSNRTEHLELRISALVMILSSQPTTETFMNILWFMSAEKNPHLYNFYYSTVQSLIDTTYPCYMHLTPDAAKLAKLIPIPNIETKFTENEIIDYTNPTYGFAGLLNTVVIADEISGDPNIFSLNMISSSYGFFSAEYAIFLRIEGVAHEIDKNTFKAMDENSKDDLENLLKIIKVAPRTNKPIHFEYIVQQQGQTVMSLYLNETVIKNVKGGVAAMATAAKDFHANFQHVDQAIMSEILHASDIGIGVSIEQVAPYIMSVRGNFTNSAQGTVLARQIELDLRLNLQVNFNLRNYNPFGGMLQGAHRSYYYESRIPLSFTISLDMAQKSLKIRRDWEPKKQLISFQLHAKSEAFVAGRNSKVILSQTCSKCTSAFLASKGENYRKNKNLMRKKILASEIELEVNLFDCEEENIIENRRELIRTFFCPIGKNARAEQSFSTILGLQTTYDAITTPLKGSCGLAMKSVSVGTASNAEIVFKFEDKNDRFLLRALFSIRTPSGGLVRSYDTNIIFDTKNGNKEHFSVKARITRQIPDEPLYMVCVKLENTYPKTKSPWYILYDKEVRETRHNLAIEFGETTDSSKCPSGDSTQIQISGTSRTQVLDPSTWPMAQCEKDRGDHKLYPASGACGKAMFSANIANNFTFNIKQNNVSPTMKSAMEHMNAIQKLFTSEVTEIPKDFTINMETSPQNEYLLQISSKEHGVVDYTPILSPKFRKSVSKLMSVGAFYPSKGTPNMIFGLNAICAMAGSKMMPFSNATIDWPVSTKYKLMAADCGSTPSYGIFAYNPEGSESVNLKIYILGDLIELQQTENIDDPLLKINNIAQANGIIEAPEGLKIKRNPHTIEISNDEIDLFIAYSYTSVAIMIPDKERNNVCGLCGLSLTEPYSGPEGPLEDLNQFIEAYTLSS